MENLYWVIGGLVALVLAIVEYVLYQNRTIHTLNEKLQNTQRKELLDAGWTEGTILVGGKRIMIPPSPLRPKHRNPPPPEAIPEPLNSPTSVPNKELVETLAETNKLLRELLNQSRQEMENV